MDTLRQEIRVALRGLRRSPAFTITAIAILVIGIGMSVAMFTVFRTVLVGKLPVVDQDRIAVMWTYRVPTTDFACSAKCLDEVRRRSTTMADIAPVVHWPTVNVSLADGERSLALAYTQVGANFFDVLGARAVLGRLFRSGEDDAPVIPPNAVPTPPAPLNAVLSYRAWIKTFHGDSSIIGRRLIQPLFKLQYTIIGVAPPGLDYPSGVEIWFPMMGGREAGYSSFGIVRLKPGATIASARDEYVALSNRIEPLLKATGAHAASFGDTVIGSAKPVILLLTFAVALLLLITCLNVGNLSLLRASSRARELGLRRILGASYGEVIRQLLIESALVATAGGVLGLSFAAVLLRAVRLLAPRTLPRVDELVIANTPILLAIAITIVAMLIFGVIPSLAVARAGQGGVLRIDAHTGNETRRRRVVRQTLVASQVALAMLTLGGAGLLVRSLERLEHQDAGYSPDGVAILDVTWDVMRIYRAPEMSELAQRLEKRIAQVPGVSSATPLVVPPLLGTGVWQLRLDKEGQTLEEGANNPALTADVVGVDFFKTFNIRLLKGRIFNADDRATSPLVLVVNEGFANQYWPGENPIGKRVRLPVATNDNFVGANGWRTVVGVVANAHLRAIRDATPMAYFPVTQGYWQGAFAIKTNVPVTSLTPALAAAIHDVGDDAALGTVDRMDDLLAIPLAEPRLSALLMSVFGIVALLLSAIGLYGVLASLVRDQTRDIGIRMALGATASRVRDDVLVRAGVTVGIGAVVGIGAALFASRLIKGMLYQVAPTDPIALLMAAAVLVGVGVIAAYIPARRATRIDPVQALRAE